MKTSNTYLQATLDTWVAFLKAAHQAPSKKSSHNGPVSRSFKEDIIDRFVRSFVPFDVDEADIENYSSSLKEDQEFFESLLRELTQCSTGEGVESVINAFNTDPSKGSNSIKAMYILLPPEGTLSEGADFEVVRELAFISLDGGNTWRAEG